MGFPLGQIIRVVAAAIAALPFKEVEAVDQNIAVKITRRAETLFPIHQIRRIVGIAKAALPFQEVKTIDGEIAIEITWFDERYRYERFRIKKIFSRDAGAIQIKAELRAVCEQATKSDVAVDDSHREVLCE